MTNYKCRVCKLPKASPAEFLRHDRYLCKACNRELGRPRLEAQKAERAVRLAAEREARAEERAMHQRIRAGGKASTAGLYETIQRQAEQAWGPSTRWTRAQHERVSVALRAAAGIAEDRGRCWARGEVAA